MPTARYIDRPRQDFLDYVTGIVLLVVKAARPAPASPGRAPLIPDGLPACGVGERWADARGPGVEEGTLGSRPKRVKRSVQSAGGRTQMRYGIDGIDDLDENEVQRPEDLLALTPALRPVSHPMGSILRENPRRDLTGA